MGEYMVEFVEIIKLLKHKSTQQKRVHIGGRTQRDEQGVGERRTRSAVRSCCARGARRLPLLADRSYRSARGGAARAQCPDDADPEGRAVQGAAAATHAQCLGNARAAASSAPCRRLLLRHPVPQPPPPAFPGCLLLRHPVPQPPPPAFPGCLLLRHPVPQPPPPAFPASLGASCSGIPFRSRRLPPSLGASCSGIPFRSRRLPPSLGASCSGIPFRSRRLPPSLGASCSGIPFRSRRLPPSLGASCSGIPFRSRRLPPSLGASASCLSCPCEAAVPRVQITELWRYCHQEAQRSKLILTRNRLLLKAELQGAARGRYDTECSGDKTDHD
ncbi:inverted formin-2-like [Poecile atricapillus]|uniref:inverted formin-2-like n=1 Tax=Poecile atricapillus TaxID=48891 RepID=UPI002739E363|nr:inverted formin-2-like [Poecile atricapillus]